MGMAGTGSLRRTAGYDKKRLTGYNPARRYLVCFAFCLHGIVHLLGYKSPLPGIGFFWQVNSCRIMSKLFSLHGGSLLKPPLHSAQGRHPHKGMENGGLEMYFKTAVRIKLYNGRTKLPTPATVFFFPRLPGQDSLNYLVQSCSCSATSFSRKKLSSLMMCSIRQASASAVLGSTPAAISCSVKKQ